MKSNFKCSETGEEYFIPEYSFNGKIYKDKFGKELVSKVGAKLIPIKREIPVEDMKDVNLGTFTMMSRQEKEAHLTARSRAHSRKHTNWRDE